MKKLSLEDLQRASIEEFKAAKKNPIVVILDNVRSAMNVGSFFRTCDAFAVEKLILTGITATPPSREINKTAIGATESVEWAYHENVVDAINNVQNEGYLVAGVEQTTNSKMLGQFSIPLQKTALVFGNEVDGLHTDIFPLLDYGIEVPQFGTKHSLNVAVCGGIVIWEFAHLFFNKKED
ncbi:MAG: TrmH family RNA methyltransferase [Saprospiraceae bacterium]